MDPHVAANRALWDEWTPIHVRSAFDLRDNLEGDFDVVFTSFGALSWRPDHPRWAEVVAHFVRPGGFFYIAEAHPFAWVFDDDDTATELRLRYHYWPRPEPLELSGGQDMLFSLKATKA
jgi:SAM-dependent methyltransferase